MRAIAARVLVIAAAAFVSIVAVRADSPPAEERVITVSLRVVAPPVAQVPGHVGSMDRIGDVEGGVLIEGWVDRTLDEIAIVTEDAVGEWQEVWLFDRPDVERAGGPLLSGFSTTVRDVAVADIKCVLGRSGDRATLLWVGTGCP